MAKSVSKKVVLEVAGSQYDLDAITEKAVQDYKNNHKEAIKNFSVYVKPEDGKAYYTANDDKANGSVDL